MKTIIISLFLFIGSISVSAQVVNKDSLENVEFKKSTNLDSFAGKLKVQILFRNGEDISSQNITGSIFLSEYGITISNVLILEEILRVRFDKNSKIPLSSGQFPIIAGKKSPFYKDGILVINTDKKSGAVTMNYGTKSETVTFVVIK